MITNYDDENCQKLQFENVISYSILNESMLMAKNIKPLVNGKYSFDVFFKDKKLGIVKLGIMGYHNIYNALATIATGLYLKIGFEKIKEGIESFCGVERRNQIVHEGKNCLILHDYAHHPDEIKSTLETYRKLGENKLIAVFQPHTFSRTKDFFTQFVSAFDDCDEVWLLPIYPAREKPIKGITSFFLAKELKKYGKNVKYFKNFAVCRENINLMPQEKTLYAILGAGDIVNLASDLD